MEAASLDESYERVKNAALRLFTSKGYVATGIRDIAREADISSATLYHHVSNKEELLVAIIREGFELMTGSAQAALAGQRTPEARLAALVRNHTLVQINEQELARVVDVESRFLSEEANKEVRPLGQAYTDLWRDVLEEGVESGAFDVADTSVARMALIDMCDAPNRWMRRDGRLTPPELADAFVQMALGAVRAKRAPVARITA